MIKITEKYYIDGDPMNYILKRVSGTNKQTGEILYTTEGYFRDMQSCIKAIIRRSKREFVGENDISLKEAIVKFDEIEKDMNKKLEELLKGN